MPCVSSLRSEASEVTASVQFCRQAQPPERWVELAVEHAREEADGYFLSCTNTTQIEAIESIERRLGKPVVNSNQAVLWACAKRLQPKLGNARLGPGLGRLVNAN